MAKMKSYRLLCPISRALDRIGDRWTLLILRDLHAGPARFKDLQNGLAGIPTNLLTDRLVRLIDMELIKKSQNHLGVTVYALTARGEQSRNLLFELSAFGTLFDPDPDLKSTENYRAVAVTMSAILGKAATDDDQLRLQVNISGEPYCVTVQGGQTNMKLGTCELPEAVLSTSYQALIAIGDGDLAPDGFFGEELRLVSGNPEAMRRFLNLFGRSLAKLG